MERLYPLRFHPLYKHAVWGGRRLETRLGRPLDEGDDYAESWEIADHGEDQSIVASGPLAGVPLHHLVTERGAELLGRHAPQSRFPLLLKYLDANKRLSVQVHPNDRMAEQMRLGDTGKVEAWVVLTAESTSWIWAGLQQPVDRETLRQAIETGTLEQHLHRFRPTPGQCIFLPAGTVHALGDGLLVVEIQQSSDVTFRLYDWNRVTAGGQRRPLHIEAGLEALDCSQGPVKPREPVVTPVPHVERLVECEKFVLDRWQFRSPQHAGGDDRCHLLTVLEGVLGIEGDPTGSAMRTGQTALLPAAAGRVRLAPQSETPTCVLDAYLP